MGRTCKSSVVDIDYSDVVGRVVPVAMHVSIVFVTLVVVIVNYVRVCAHSRRRQRSRGHADAMGRCAWAPRGLAHPQRWRFYSRGSPGEHRADLHPNSSNGDLLRTVRPSRRLPAPLAY